jgi:hypothetical protein
MRARIQVLRGLGGLVAYGGLACFLVLIGTQIYRWLRDGEWVPIRISDGLHHELIWCCVREGDSGRLAALAQWLDAPTTWLGLHRVLEVIPASLSLFALSVLGNFLLIYGSDLAAREKRGG